MDLNAQLASAYGDLARGYKKLRDLHLRGVKIPVPKSESDNEEAEIGMLGELSVKELLADKNMWCGERESFMQKFLEATLGNDVLRMDKFKNAWRYNSSRKNNWEKISGKQLDKEFFSPLANFLSDVVEFVNHIENAKELAKIFPKLKNHRGKYNRLRRIVPELVLKEREFRSYLVNIHESLKSLR
jgi:hypothetical protein